MGLLDGFNFNDPQTQGLLAAASQMLQQSGPSRMPIGTGQILGTGLSAFNTGMQAQQQRTLEQDQARQMAQMRGLQIQGLQGEMQDKGLARKQSLAAQQWLQNYNAGQASPTAAAQRVLGSSMAPTIENASTLAVAQQPGDQQGQVGGTQSQFLQRMQQAQAMRASGNPMLMTQADALEQTALKFKPEFDQTPRVGLGQDGKPFSYVLDKSGNVKRLDGVLPRDELHFQDTGGGYAGLDKFTGLPVVTGKKTMTAGEMASNGIARERLNFDRQQALQPQFNAELGGFISRPTAAAPGGALTPLTGYAKPDKPLTESQGKASLFVSRMDKANQVIGELGAAGLDRASMLAPLGGVGNWAISKDKQRLGQAQDDFVSAALRLESGAVISKEEADAAKKLYFPQPGDSPEVIAQKSASRTAAIQGMSLMAGPGAKQLGVGQQQVPSASAFSIMAPNGKTYTFANAKDLANFKLSAGIK